jgi:hypothetical protein
MFRKLDMFLSSGVGWETPTLLGSLKRANLNHWTTYVSITTAIYCDKACIDLKLRKGGGHFMQ